MDNQTIDLVVLDIAGTTMSDDGVVTTAFDEAYAAVDGDPADHDRATQIVLDTMGESKVEVFDQIFGDRQRAERAASAFEQAYAGQVAQDKVTPIPGAREAVDALVAAGLAVAFNTGFTRDTVEALFAAASWSDLAERVITPAEAGRGRPAPDMALTALIRNRTQGVGSMVVVGDTPTDMRTGRNAGAGRIVGVLTGGASRQALLDAGATDVLDSVADLPGLLGV